jgi:hypothetical protein
MPQNCEKSANVLSICMKRSSMQNAVTVAAGLTLLPPSNAFARKWRMQRRLWQTYSRRLRII